MRESLAGDGEIPVLDFSKSMLFRNEISAKEEKVLNDLL